MARAALLARNLATYTRIANPTLALLEGRLAALEEGAGAVVFGSGMGAITATLWSCWSRAMILADLTLCWLHLRSCTTAWAVLA